jgi:hypothetical protein
MQRYIASINALRARVATPVGDRLSHKVLREDRSTDLDRRTRSLEIMLGGAIASQPWLQPPNSVWFINRVNEPYLTLGGVCPQAGIA